MDCVRYSFLSRLSNIRVAPMPTCRFETPYLLSERARETRGRMLSPNFQAGPPPDDTEISDPSACGIMDHLPRYGHGECNILRVSGACRMRHPPAGIRCPKVLRT